MALAIRETEVAGERFMTLGATLLVASKSEANVWHQIENATCTCKGFQYRGHCRHIAAALEMEAEQSTDTMVTVTWSERFGGCWIVEWLGYMHGLGHYQEVDAHRHADDLRHTSDAERNAWLEQHGYGAPIPPPSRPPIPFPVPTSYAVQKEEW